MHFYKTALILLISFLLSTNMVSAKSEEKSSDNAVQEVIAQPATTMEPNGVYDKVPANKVGFALSLAGGGARGAAHIGVLKVLEKENLRPDFITGSSIGAVIGSLWAAGMSAAEIEQLITSGKFRKAFFPIPLKLKGALHFPFYALLRLISIKPGIGIYSGKSITRFMNSSLPAGVANFQDTKIPMAVTSINILDTRPVWFTKGNIAEAVRASCSIPFIYRPLKRDGQILVDGGIRENLPTDVAQAAGAPLVVAVRLHGYLNKISPKKVDTNLEYLDRVASIFMAEIEQKSVPEADIVIKPQIHYMESLSFTAENLNKAIVAGEAAALEAVPSIRKLLKEQAFAKREAKNKSL